MIVGFCDMQGRLMGKRVHAPAFLDGIATHGAEGCNYLLAVDVDMNTVPGYAFASWERGYGDFVLRPDLSTLRRIPWLPGTALCLCDLEWHDGSPVTPSPRQILRAPARRGWPSAAGARWSAPSSSSCSSPRATRSAVPRATATSSPRTPTTSTTRSSARPTSSRCCAPSGSAWQGPACPSRTRRASATSASTR